MRALKHRVVVELGIVGQPVVLPASQQAGHSAPGAELEQHPGIRKRCMQALGRKDVHQRTPSDLQVFDKIETIHLRSACHHLGQIPALRRRGTAYASAAILQPMAQEHSVNGGQRRLYRGPFVLQRPLNRPRPIFTQNAFTERLAKLDDALLCLGADSIPRATRPLRSKVDSIQAMSFRPMHPHPYGTRVHL